MDWDSEKRNMSLQSAVFWLQTSTSYRSCRIFKQKVWSNSFQQKKIYQKSHDEAWFQKNIWFFWILIKFSTTCIKIVVFILSIFFIFLALNSYLHFFAFMCVYFSLYCLISNQLKVHFVFKTLSPKNALDNGRFSFRQIQKYKNINDNLHLSLSAY